MIIIVRSGRRGPGCGSHLLAAFGTLVIIIWGIQKLIELFH